jgi:hypothetical protein
MSGCWSAAVRGLSPYVPGERLALVRSVKLNTVGVAYTTAAGHFQFLLV